MARMGAMLWTASIASLALGSVSAAAQTSEDQSTDDRATVESAPVDEEVIVVTGVRRSVESALEVKRESVQVSDSIVAEDIGKLPDNSVTEALQRVTGVQIARGAGEGTQTLVRGLPNVVTTLNGRNIFTTTGRGIALADIPADLLKQVDVYKTAIPENLAGGIAGGINVQLRRPFDLEDGITLSASGRMVYSEEAGRADPILSGLVGGKWETGAGEFGALLSVSHQARHFQENNTFNGTYDLVPDPGGSGVDVFRPFVIGAIYNIGKRERNSVNAALQWTPTPSLSFYAEGFYVKFRNDNELNFWIPLPGLIGGPDVVTTLKPDSNVLASISGGRDVFSLTSNQAFRNRSETWQGAFGTEWEFADDLVLTGDIAYTRSTAANRGAILDTAFIAPLLSVDFDRDGASSATVTQANGQPFSVTDPANFFLNQFFDQYTEQQGDELAGMAALEWTPFGSVLTSVKGGVRYATRDAQNQAANGGGVPIVGFVGATDPRLDGLTDISPADLLEGITTVDTRQWYVANREFLLDNTDVIRPLFGLPAGLPGFAPTNFFDDREKTLSGYAQAGFDFAAAGVPIDGLIGVRVENVKSSLNGTAVNTDSSTGEIMLTPVSIDKDDTEWLPSLNLRYRFTDNLFLRFAAARTVTRPNFADLNPQTTLTAPGPTLPGAGSGGNPNLDNIKSNSFDVALEWYFRPGSLASVTGFRRDVEGYVVRDSVDEFYPNEDGEPQRFSVNRPFSSGSGRLQGVEVAFTHFFDYLPGLLSGFGVQLNGTYIDGELSGLVERTTPFPNVSKYAYNAIAIYEKDGFSARLAYNWRDKYFVTFSEFQNVPTNNLPSVIQNDIGYLDLSTSYRVNENLLLSFDAVNLLKSTVRNYFGGPGNDRQDLFPRDVVATDRTFSIGARVRF